MMNQAIRVYVLARERRVSAEKVLEVARRLGYDVPNQLITLDSAKRAAVEKSLDELPPDEFGGVPSRLQPRGPGPRAAHQELSPNSEE